MPLTGHKILIVETEISPFVTALQRSLEAEGAETLVARTLVTALHRAGEGAFTAIVANREHDVIKARVDTPVLIYDMKSAGGNPDSLVKNVKRMLAH